MAKLRQAWRERIFVGNNTQHMPLAKLEPGSEIVCWKNSCDYEINTFVGYVVDSRLQIQICCAQNSGATMVEL